MKKSKKIIILIIFILGLFLLGFLYYNWEDAKSEIIFFDVGQGDSVLINLPGDNEILIDGGPDRSILYRLGEYLPIYNRDIELMVLTHPHADHVAGLVEVLKNYKVDKVLYTDVKYDSEIYIEFIKLIKNIEKIKPYEMRKIFLDEDNVLEIIYPWEDLTGKKFENQNDNSIVVKLNTKNLDVLLMGDAEENIEEEILDKVSGLELSASILKVGHHGSKTSSSEGFIKKVNPEFGIISCGKDNKFKHPSLRTVSRLERIGVKVLRTDEVGDVVFDLKQKIE